MLKLNDLTPGMSLHYRPKRADSFNECLWLLVAVDRENDAAWVLIFFDGRSQLRRYRSAELLWGSNLHALLDHEGTDITGQLNERIRRIG
jgi:hypothetical protein